MLGAGATALTGWLRGRTLRARLVCGVLALFTLTCVGVGWATAAELHANLLARLDAQLGQAQQLALSLERPDSDNGQPVSGDGDVIGAPPGTPAHTFVAWLAGGQVVRVGVEQPGKGLVLTTGSVGLQRMLRALPADNHPHSRELPGLGDYRLVAVPGVDGDVHVTGLPLADVTNEVTHFELEELLIVGIALVVVGLGVLLVVRLSLRPLRRMAVTAAEVSQVPLASGEVDLPHRASDDDPRTEVGRLGAAFNRMLGHVEGALAARQASEAYLRQFIADASHELRTPLAGIRSYAELGLRSPREADRSLRRVQSSALRMSHLVDDLLLLARLDAGRPLADEPVDLTRLAIEATSDARVAGPRQRWTLDLPEEPVVLRGDELRLHQVLDNLLANARLHTPAGTTVTVRVGRPAPELAELEVVDDGPGIPPTVREHLFERFVRGDSARTAGDSNGLGLAIVAAVVEAHGGRVDVESRPGRTAFRIRLPVRPAPGSRPAAPSGGAGPAAPAGDGGGSAPGVPPAGADEREVLTEAGGDAGRPRG